MSRPADLFVLERVENPHPRMLVAETSLYETARAQWAGYLQAMCAATGCESAEIISWMDRHKP